MTVGGMISTGGIRLNKGEVVVIKYDCGGHDKAE